MLCSVHGTITGDAHILHDLLSCSRVAGQVNIHVSIHTQLPGTKAHLSSCVHRSTLALLVFRAPSDMAPSQIFSFFARAKRPNQFVRDFSYYSWVIATWIPAYIFFNTHVAETRIINGASMYPYLNSGYNESLTRDVGFVNKWNPLAGLRRGMLVTFWYILQFYLNLELWKLI